MKAVKKLIEVKKNKEEDIFSFMDKVQIEKVVREGRKANN